MKIKFSHPILRALAALPKLCGAYLVGGAVRDLIMSRELSDIDIAVPGNPEDICREVAEALNGTAFILDKERDVWRAALRDGGQVDISKIKPPAPGPSPASKGGEQASIVALPLSGGGIKGGGNREAPLPSVGEGWERGGIVHDLSARDFTIDAMAVPFPEGRATGGEVIGPFGGIKDIENKIIRALSKDALSDDPLRMLRAFRLAHQLDFRIEEETLEAINELSGLIEHVSPERIRDELYIILELTGSWKAFRDMADAGLLERVLPETKPMRGLPQGEAHQYDLLGHSLKAMEYAEGVMLYPEEYFYERAEISTYLDERVDGNLTMRGLIKLAALLHDSGKPHMMIREEGRIRFTGHDMKGSEINEKLAERLKLSSRAKGLLMLTARHHMRPLHMTKEPVDRQQGITRHAMYRYVRDVNGDLPASLIIALADAFATREKPESVATDVEGVVISLSEYYYGEFLKAEEEPLLRGRDLIEEFNLKPGPLFSELLEEVKEKRAEGAIKTREEAIEHIKNKLGPTHGSAPTKL